MLESEQAQAIRDIDERHGWLVLTFENETQPGDGREAHEDRGKLLEIVDSQAQKIEKLLAENNVLSILVDELKADREAQSVRLEKVESLYAIARTQVEEQAKEIERLRNVTNAISFGTYTALEVRLHLEKLADFDAARLQK